MPTRKLTDLFVERAKAPTYGRVEYFDAAFPGLALRITNNGGKSWSIFYRFKGRLRRFTIGGYPAIKPAQARIEAAAALELVREGVDPAEEKRARRDLCTPETDTFGATARDYLETQLKRNNRTSTYREAKRDLESNVLPKWRNRSLASIGPDDVNRLIDAIVERGAEIQANRTLARLRAFFNWAIRKRRLSISPVAGMEPPTKERARDRVLSDDELRWFWQACEDSGWPFGPLFKLLLLTAQRRNEVAGMTWAEVDLGKRVWTIPRHKTKNDRAHEIQLSEAAIEVLRSLPRLSSDDDLVFTVTGLRSVSGFSRAKRRIDAAMARASLSENGRGFRKANKPLLSGIPDWRLHDLRRTAATGMARMNFPPHVVDKVLNHASGTIQGVAAVYNRFAYIDERRAALEAWCQYITNLVTPGAENIVAFRG
jgi:integrase